MRKISCYLLLGLLGALFYGCKQDQIVSPATPSFTVSTTTPLVDVPVTFTVNSVANAQAVTLFPYGTEVSNVLQSSVSIAASSFVNGKAQVSFTYSKIGTFQAVVIANAHSANGNTVQNVSSAAQAMTVSSTEATLLTFGLLLNPTVPADSTTVLGYFPRSGVLTALTLQLPFGNGKTQTNLATGVKGAFTSSAFSTVTTSATSNNYSSTVTITVTAADGVTKKTYTLTSSITPAEVTKSFTAQAKDVSKSAKNKILGAAVDSVGGTVVIYDTLGSPSTDFDSLRFEYTFKGQFAALKYGNKALKQDSLFNLASGASKTFVAHGQDSTSQSYAVYAAAAPKLVIQFEDLWPEVFPTTNGFAISGDVLNGTDVTSIDTYAYVTASPGTTINGITYANGTTLNFGDSVDFTKPVVFWVSVTDSNLGGITYQIPFTATINVVK